ncbi:MAG TPA: DsbE family thiol:disulfide interchange protein [Allosphingosinicella sp.]|jgi:cytochrome c biogenesis protein CcmG/thiol:disulfide interchange protein DsbE
MKRLILWLPLGLFAVFLLAVAFGLSRSPETVVRSQLIGKPLPDFALEAIVPNHPGLSSADLKRGQPRLLNVFASWCGPCATESPQLLELKRRGIPIDAIAIRDRPQDVAAFLGRYGDPFERIGSDPNLQVQMAFGSSGVPETFIVDGKGIIRHQHIGEIRPEHVAEIVKAYEAAR